MPPSDDSLGEILRDRMLGHPPNRTEDADRLRRSRRHLTDDQAARLFDAAIAVLAATRSMVGVGEDILRERRDRLTEHREEAENDASPDRATRRRIDLTY